MSLALAPSTDLRRANGEAGFFAPMRRGQVPEGGLKYWLSLCAASVLGCNTGDAFAMAFGTLAGLPLLIAGFAATLILGRRAGRPTQAFYWLAIILVRTAATNLADFAGQRFGAAAFAVVAALFAATLFKARGAAAQPSNALPSVDGLYWLRMLLAGTLGTMLGDMGSFMSGLGLGGASLALSGMVAALIAARQAGVIASTLSFWFIVVAIRAAGTSLGDFSAHQIGLGASAAVAALALGAILFFRAKPPARPAPLAAAS